MQVLRVNRAPGSCAMDVIFIKLLVIDYETKSSFLLCHSVDLKQNDDYQHLANSCDRCPGKAQMSDVLVYIFTSERHGAERVYG